MIIQVLPGNKSQHENANFRKIKIHKAAERNFSNFTSIITLRKNKLTRKLNVKLAWMWLITFTPEAYWSIWKARIKLYFNRKDIGNPT